MDQGGIGIRRAGRARPATQRLARSAGFSYVELTIGMVILIVATGGLFASLLESRALERTNDESARAYAAAERMLEEIAGTEFAVIFATYNDSTFDDAGLPARGSGFAVPGLQPQAADPDGFVGRIEFPRTPGVPAHVLREDVDDASFAMPRDLNADGDVDTADHAFDYTLLPVRVHVEWTGLSGDRSIWIETLLAER